MNHAELEAAGVWDTEIKEILADPYKNESEKRFHLNNWLFETEHKKDIINWLIECSEQAVDSGVVEIGLPHNLTNRAALSQ